MAIPTYNLFTKAITFGDCGCSGMQANFATVILPYFGINRFDEKGLRTLTKYLRVDRTLVSPQPLPGGVGTQSWYDYYTGWVVYNQWTSAETKSHPTFVTPDNFAESSVTVLSPTERLIIFDQIYFDEGGFQKNVQVTLREVASIPWTAYALRDKIYTDLQTAVPWNNPFYYDAPHYFWWTFGYNFLGQLTPSGNSFALTGNCKSQLIVGNDMIGDPYYPGSVAVSAMRRPYPTRIQRRVTNFPREWWDNPVPSFFCGNITSTTTAIGDSYVVQANQIILHPSIADMQSLGIQAGKWAFATTLVC
jgi:hypothetical protein